MRLKRTIPILLILNIFLAGCSANNETSSSSGTGAGSFANYNTTELYPEGFQKKEPLSCDRAVEIIEGYLKKTDNVHYIVEKIDFINERVYYIVRRYEDLPDRIATLGFFAVDVLTGEAYNTNALTDLVPMDK